MSLKATHIPLSCSIRSQVIQRYAERSGGEANGDYLSLEELVAYLATISDFDLNLVEAVGQQTEAIGDPAIPQPEHQAILHWVSEAWSSWEKDYSLDDLLAAPLKQLMPLTAAMAVSDVAFFTPGVHPLHRMLDAIQNNGVGWQEKLGRAGQALKDQVETSVVSARGWFDNHQLELEITCSAAVTMAERDQTRALRMARRAVETESGRDRTLASKAEAARMINTCLDEQPLPPAINQFLTSDWYESAQLVLLKFGVASAQWQQMQETTQSLAASVQAYGADDGDRRKQLFEQATQLPKSLRRWLLSLQHDPEAVSESLGLVEFVHLRLLRQQDMERQPAELLVIAEEDSDEADTDIMAAVNSLKAGRWYQITGNEESLRLKLAMKNEARQQLMFTNRSGVKTQTISFTHFAELLSAGQVVALGQGAGFSLCLLRAAGLVTEDQLAELVQQGSEPETDTDLIPQDIDPEPGTDPVIQDIEPALDTDPVIQDIETEPDTDPVMQDIEPEPTADLMQLDIGRESDRTLSPSIDASPTLAADIPATLGEFTTENLADSESLELELPDLDDDAQPDALSQPPAVADTPPDTIGQDEELNLDQQRWLQQQSEKVNTDAVDLVPAVATPKAGASINTSEGHTLIAMGTWLGFHDGETPIMAKLAVHDRKLNSYIFVNREGIKLRQHTREELSELFDQGLVDILETHSNFREEVDRARRGQKPTWENDENDR
ncbi:MAG: DUF1631 family protein [Halioglobus sp.]